MCSFGCDLDMIGVHWLFFSAPPTKGGDLLPWRFAKRSFRLTMLQPATVTVTGICLVVCSIMDGDTEWAVVLYTYAKPTHVHASNSNSTPLTLALLTKIKL
jgi:hypothetical protein